MASPQTLSVADRRLVATWAADCAERVLPLFEAEAPHDTRPRDALVALRGYLRGEVAYNPLRKLAFVAHAAARDVRGESAKAAAHAAGQAASVAHMGAHALGAAAYAAKAAGAEEIRWQLDHMSPDVKATLRKLPDAETVEPNSLLGSGGLLGRGAMRGAVLELQAGVRGEGSRRPQLHFTG